MLDEMTITPVLARRRADGILIMVEEPVPPTMLAYALNGSDSDF